MTVYLSEDCRITTDPYNFIIESRKISGENAKVQGQVRWEAETFHPSLAQALEYYILHTEIKKEDEITIQELISVLHEVAGRVEEICKQKTP